MTITYTNRRGQTYFLRRKTTKTGRVSYVFALKEKAGAAVAELPAGYEIYEHPRGQVFLRKIPPQIILPAERALVEAALRRRKHLELALVDVVKKQVIVYMPNQDDDLFNDLTRLLGPARSAAFSAQLTRIRDYSPEMRFVLVDKKARSFLAERMCYLGGIDDWTQIGGPAPLAELAAQFLPYLGTEAFFDLY